MSAFYFSRTLENGVEIGILDGNELYKSYSSNVMFVLSKKLVFLAKMLNRSLFRLVRHKKKKMLRIIPSAFGWIKLGLSALNGRRELTHKKTEITKKYLR